jgi:phospholipid/cholesterol/gamma-HCH transport system substrate-binding protein
MQKSAPTFGRIAAMVLFSLSCFGILTFLWIAFGGPVPLKSSPYQVKVNFPEAATIAEQADVRISGVTVGKVQSKSLDRGASRVTAVLNIEPKYAPLPRDTKAILRQKTLLGETYVELSPGTPGSGKLKDGTTLSNVQVEPTVTLDQILRIFDARTRTAFRGWLAVAAEQFRGSSPMDLNDALGNLAGFAQNGAGTLSVLDAQSAALRDVVHNTGVVFGALNERTGQLRQLILNSSDTFGALSSEQVALADTFRTFPTFLDESRATLARTEAFARNTKPLVDALKPVADKLAPTFHDLGVLAPDLKDLFIRLKPVIAASPRDLPQGARFLRGAPPVFKGLTVFLPEFNPILSFLNYNQDIVAHFFANAGNATYYRESGTTDGQPHHLLGFWGVIVDKSFNVSTQVPPWDRGNSYDLPNWATRSVNVGSVPEAFTCRFTASGGEEQVSPPNPPSNPDGYPPCFVAAKQLYNGKQYTFLQSGSPVRTQPAPNDFSGTPPADYNRPLTHGR